MDSKDFWLFYQIAFEIYETDEINEIMPNLVIHSRLSVLTER